MLLAYLMALFPGMLVVLLIQPTLHNFSLILLTSGPWGLCIYAFRERHVNAQCEQRRVRFLKRILSKFEEKWSTEVRELNDKYQQYGITVDTCCKGDLAAIQPDLLCSIGFVFRFHLQPRNQEEAAWFLAHCQISADSDYGRYEPRTVRIMPADPSACEGIALQGGTKNEMAASLMVDAEDDFAGHVRDS